MPTGSGARLGPYQLGPVIGAGGMGEVYRARDSRLGRDVAIKILPAEVAADPDRLRRFEQEARAAAALNHPNILSVHDVGTDNGVTYLVTELLEGQTLREALTSPDRGLSMDRALDSAVQIADGLAAAHARGIVHRDLKPENLFVTSDGHVKILDFGLAKFTDTSGSIDGNSPNSPTELTPANTGSGVILGTVGYMAPEQVRGQAVDARTDIFAFGCVLYELLTGTRAFHGDTAMDTLSAILSRAPMPLAEARPGTVAPPALARIVERCLEKAPGARFQTATDLAFALRHIAATSVTSDGRSAALEAVIASERTRLSPRSALPWVVTLLSLAAAAARWWSPVAPATAESTYHLTLPIPETIDMASGPEFALSRDGMLLAYIVQEPDGVFRIYLRRLNEERSSALPQTEGALGGLAFSPDSRWITFNRRHPNGSKLKVPIDGGLATILVAPVVEEVENENNPACSPDGRWLAYHTGGPGAGIYVRPLTGSGAVVYVGPGTGPVHWIGNELFFLRGAGQVMVAPISIAASLAVGSARALFTLPARTALADVAPDGQRFLLMKTVSEPADNTPPKELRIILNFAEEVRRKVAGGQ
jgi:serine/threonine protein kinase